MPTRDNPIMLRSGYVTARRVAEALGKSSQTVHRMVEAGAIDGTKEGGVYYIKLASLEAHYADNAPMRVALRPLRDSPAR